MEYESYKMTHIYNEEGNNKGGNHEPVNRFEFKKKGCMDPRIADLGKLLKGDAVTRGRTNRSLDRRFGPDLKKGCRIHRPPVWSEF